MGRKVKTVFSLLLILLLIAFAYIIPFTEEAGLKAVFDSIASK